VKPAINRFVTVRTVESFNGSHVSPAVITRAWGESDTSEGPQCVNVTAFPDLSPPRSYSSVMLYDSEEQAEAAKPVGTYAFVPARA
jgi:hypothetical protein